MAGQRLVGGLVRQLHQGRFLRIVGILVLLFVFGFVIYSAVFKVWCLQHEAGWAGQQVWGAAAFDESQSKCVKKKSLFSF